MQNKKFITLIAFTVVFAVAKAQPVDAVLAYIAKYKDMAISEMLRTGVPAAITLAQGIHETEAGTSVLVKKSNNHFGIKCKSNWVGRSVSHDDDARGECFRAYDDPSESYKDHSDFLKSSPRYAFLFNLDPLDYEAWAYGLKKAGYATNPKYSQVLIKLIKEYNLQNYTLLALGKNVTTPEVLVKNDAEQLEEIEKDTKTAGVMAVSKTTLPEEKVEIIPTTIGEKNYPEGEFKLNDTRVVFVKKGTSFLTIAQKYELPLARLFEFNEMPAQEVAAADQLVFIQRKRKTGNNEFHTVQPGETLQSIAQVEALRLESLLEYNNLKADMQPNAGEVLSLRTKSATTPRLAAKKQAVVETEEKSKLENVIAKNTKVVVPGNNASVIYHIVQPKETVYSIAKKYNVSFDALINWNQLNGYDLKIGQSLKIYK